jgi:hypothetical protein
MSSTIEKELVDVIGPGLCRVPRKGVSSDAASATAKTRGRRGSKLDAIAVQQSIVRVHDCDQDICFDTSPGRNRHFISPPG